MLNDFRVWETESLASRTPYYTCIEVFGIYIDSIVEVRPVGKNLAAIAVTGILESSYFFE